MSKPVPSLQHPVQFTRTGEVVYEKVDHLPKVGQNARLMVADLPDVVEMHGVDGWLAFWHASKETGFMPTAPGVL